MRTVGMALIAMGVTFLLLRALQGLLFNVPLLVAWILIGLLCIGAGKTRLHYHAYLNAAARDDAHAREAMASELTLIHGIPPECDEREFLRELQNALLWNNFRFYLAPLFWLIVGGPWGPVTLVGYAFLRAGSLAGALSNATPAFAIRYRCDPACAGLDPGATGGCRLCAAGTRREGVACLVCVAGGSAYFAISGAYSPCAVFFSA